MDVNENNISYEDAIKELNDIIMKIESSSATVEQALNMIDRAKVLITICYKELDKAKGKITEIKETVNGLEEVD